MDVCRITTWSGSSPRRVARQPPPRRVARQGPGHQVGHQESWAFFGYLVIWYPLGNYVFICHNSLHKPTLPNTTKSSVLANV